MSEVRIRVAYYGIDHAGRATVMVSNDYHDAQRPGYSRGITQSFHHTEDLASAKSLAMRMKTTNKVDLIKEL